MSEVPGGQGVGQASPSGPLPVPGPGVRAPQWSWMQQLGKLVVSCRGSYRQGASMPAALLQVWCYVTTVTWGRLFMHDLATGAAVELEGARSEPAVLAIHQDNKGFIWLGHKGGLVRVWSEAARRPVCPVKKCFHSEIRCGTRRGTGRTALLPSRQSTRGNARNCAAVSGLCACMLCSDMLPLSQHKSGWGCRLQQVCHACQSCAAGSLRQTRMALPGLALRLAT